MTKRLKLVFVFLLLCYLSITVHSFAQEQGTRCCRKIFFFTSSSFGNLLRAFRSATPTPPELANFQTPPKPAESFDEPTGGSSPKGEQNQVKPRPTNSPTPSTTKVKPVGITIYDKSTTMETPKPTSSTEINKTDSEGDFNCEYGSTHIDVSMCEGYDNYANNENANSAEFFNEIIRNANEWRSNSNEEIVIRVPQATFYFFDSDNNSSSNNGFIDMNGLDKGIYPNYHIMGIDANHMPTFQDKDNDVTKNFIFFSHGNDNITLRNIIFLGNNKNKYNFGLVTFRNSGGHVVLNNLKCSGTYGDRPKNQESEKGGTCILLAYRSHKAPVKSPNYLQIINSTITDFKTGLVIDKAKRVNITNNTLDTSDPCQGCQDKHNTGNVMLAAYNINEENTDSRSTFQKNTFIQDGNSSGCTALALMGKSNKINILNNTFRNIEDRTIYVASHNIAIDPPCLGGPKDVKIIGNTITGDHNLLTGDSTISAISVLNQPVPDESRCNKETATIRNVVIAGNTINASKIGIELASTPHAPLHTVDVYKNTIIDSGLAYPQFWFRVNGLNTNLTGACIELLGLQGKNNNPNDIQIHDNYMQNCEVGMYLMASFWPLSDNNSGLGRIRTNYQQNKYISIYNNTINNKGIIRERDFPEQYRVDIITQNEPVQGSDIKTIRLRNNVITTNPKSEYSENRCNVACTSNSECLASVPTLYGSGTKIVDKYPTKYVCASGVCRNSANVNDKNCDLNDETMSEPQPLLSKEICSEENKTCCYEVALCEAMLTNDELRYYETCHKKSCVPDEYKGFTEPLTDYFNCASRTNPGVRGRDIEMLRQMLANPNTPTPPAGCQYIQ